VKRQRLAILLIAVAVAIALIGVIVFVLSGQRVRRNPVFRPEAPGVTAPRKKAAGIPPVDRWTAEFARLAPADLDDLLDEIVSKQPDLYKRWSLGYLHARAKLELNDLPDAQSALAPFLAAGNPLRDLALYHQSEIDDAANNPVAASEHRDALIFGYPTSVYRDQAIDDEVEHLSAGKPQPLMSFASRLYPSSSTSRKRDFDARIAESLIHAGDVNGGLARAIPLLRAGTMDDASDRASRALDKPELLRRLPAAQLALLGDAFRNHRHFDRAVAVLTLALPGLPQKRDDLTFSIGRSYFGNEQFAEAQQTYLKGASTAATPAQKSMFLWHAARSAQLLGDDAGAERLMTSAIAVGGRSPSAQAALTQRIRTRLAKHRTSEAAADLGELRKLAPDDRTIADGALAYGIAMVGAGNGSAAVTTLNSVPPKLLDPWDRAEFAYWRGRALESSDPRAAFQWYLTVLRADVPAHFAYFARQRLDAPAMASKLAQELATRDAQIAQLMAAKNYVRAKDVETDRILLSARDRSRALATLTSIYREVPAYRAVLELKPSVLPKFPLPPPAAVVSPEPALQSASATSAAGVRPDTVSKPAAPKKRTKTSRTAKATKRKAVGKAPKRAPVGKGKSSHTKTIAKPAAGKAVPPAPKPPVVSPAHSERASLLMAMGLDDEAADEIVRRYPLQPMSSALTQSAALNHGNVSKQSILAIEIMMKSVPQDFVPDLLPQNVRELLYPRYFYGYISDDSKKYGADPTLVLSIMREESRFNPRAKSEAAARGLLQFIITTARDIGRGIGLVDVSADDLYDPRVIIQLGAKYIATLSKEFANDHYKVAGAYNAGPKQVALWSRLAPGPGDDFFLSSINFDETKDYVRKVMNSHKRYNEIYGNAGPQGGLRAEP
jgi:soluble lytic murein transglycosylase-like protein